MFVLKYNIVLLIKEDDVWQINALVLFTLVVIFYEDMSHE